METTHLSATLTVDAPPERVFALLADPNRHTEIDGAGMLRGAVDVDGPLTAVGQTFLMEMHHDELGSYRMLNTVIAFEPDRRIGWRPQMDRAPEGRPELGGQGPRGQTYTYELEPAAGGGTVITQVYDWSAVTAPEFRARMPRVSSEELLGTLERVAKAVGADRRGTAARGAGERVGQRRQRLPVRVDAGSDRSVRRRRRGP